MAVNACKFCGEDNASGLSWHPECRNIVEHKMIPEKVHDYYAKVYAGSAERVAQMHDRVERLRKRK